MLIVRALSQTSLRASRGQPEHKFPHQAEKKSKVCLLDTTALVPMPRVCILPEIILRHWQELFDFPLVQCGKKRLKLTLFLCF